MCKFGPFCLGIGTTCHILRTSDQIFSSVYATVISFKHWNLLRKMGKQNLWLALRLTVYRMTMDRVLLRGVFTIRWSHSRCSIKKGVLKNFTKFTGKNLCWGLFIKKETPAQVFFCAFCKIFKNTFFIEHFPASVSLRF